MQDEQRKVLEMLAAGRITSEEANQLLMAIRPESRWQPAWTLVPPAIQRTSIHAPETHAHEHEQSGSRMFIALKLHGIDAAYVKMMRDLGFTDLTAQDLIAMKTHGVDPAFVREVRDLGFTDITVHGLISFKIHDIDAAYVRAIQATGFTAITPLELVSMKVHGIDGAFIQEMRDLGLDPATVLQSDHEEDAPEPTEL